MLMLEGHFQATAWAFSGAILNYFDLANHEWNLSKSHEYVLL
jgi:hypothetical protein